jgi:hypothetical protein
VASAVASGIAYGSPLIELATEAPSATTEIVVYEPTTDPTGISIGQVQWLVDFDQGVMLVGQLITFGSENDHTFVGVPLEGAAAPVTVGVEVPAEATEVAMENGVIGGRYQRVGNVIYDTTPVAPGQHTKQMVVRYLVPYDGSEIRLQQNFLYPVGQLNLLVADLPGVRITPPDLTPQESQTVQGREYRIWQGRNLPAGPQALAIGGTLRMPGTTPLLQPWAPWGSAAVVLVALLAALLWGWRQGGLARSAGTHIPTRRAELIRQIAKLDDRHALGKVDEKVWQGERARLKAELLRITGEMNRGNLPESLELSDR